MFGNLKKTIASQFFDQALSQLKANQTLLVSGVVEAPIPDIAALKFIVGDTIQDKTGNYKLLVQMIATGVIEDILKDPDKLKAFVLAQV